MSSFEHVIVQYHKLVYSPATQRLSIRSSSRASPVLDLLKQFWLGGGGFGTSEEQYCTLKESHVNTSLEFPIDGCCETRIPVTRHRTSSSLSQPHTKSPPILPPSSILLPTSITSNDTTT
ncbi:hypothetical protein D6C85_00307 [Aureobasidium pullulans]|uniref:Uncharacterized protein n=1 Tax=Aureobasidium pullulans TaxID=5580 RepID=A0A4V6TJ89_AURPU|nr:hypothetical protein D6C85_00307 [Aureobasidium pullulans]